MCQRSTPTAPRACTALWLFNLALHVLQESVTACRLKETPPLPLAIPELQPQLYCQACQGLSLHIPAKGGCNTNHRMQIRPGPPLETLTTTFRSGPQLTVNNNSNGGLWQRLSQIRDRLCSCVPNASQSERSFRACIFAGSCVTQHLWDRVILANKQKKVAVLIPMQVC